MIIGILAFVFVLGTIIVVHEFGHYYIAKKNGVLVYEFSIGFGPALYQFKRGETVYSIRAIPLGGYVSMAETSTEEDWFKEGKILFIKRNNKEKIAGIFSEVEKEKNYERLEVHKYKREGDDVFINDEKLSQGAFYAKNEKKHKMKIAKEGQFFGFKKIWQRFLIIFAGPAINFLLAIFLFSIVSIIMGFPQEEATGEDYFVIGDVTENGPSDGILEKGDKIYEVAGRDTDAFNDLVNFLDDNPTYGEFDLLIERDGTFQTVEITPLLDFTYIGFMSFNNEEMSVDIVYEDNPAYDAGMKLGDEIIGVNGTSVSSWDDFITVLNNQDDKTTIDITVLREGEEKTLVIEPWSERFLESQDIEPFRNYVGLSPDRERNIVRSIFVGSFTETATTTKQIGSTLVLLFSGEISVSELSGPVGIFHVTSIMAGQGFVPLLEWMGILSVNIGIINLLPLPALDGGRIVFLGYEKVTKKKPNESLELKLQLITMASLFGLMIYLTWTDILRFFV
jgi:regulator of sigma E protease